MAGLETYGPVIGGIAGAMGFVGWLTNRLTTRMNGIDKKMELQVSEKLCAERHRHIETDIREIKADIKEIKVFLFSGKKSSGG